MARRTITLTTDFGTRDAYAGAVKGAILGINPDANVVDITHDVPAHDVVHGAFVVAGACPVFPAETIHVCVVDPGVGSERRPLLLETPGGIFLAPDNGLLSLIMRPYRSDVGASLPDMAEPMTLVVGAVPPVCRAFVLDKPKYWKHPVSDTFHGRDVFAPVAAHLSRGVSAEEVGSVTQEVLWLNVPEPVASGAAIEGQVIYIDGFGNLVTNIEDRAMPRLRVSVEVKEERIAGLSHWYDTDKKLVAIIGSYGYLEIAAPGASAANVLGAGLRSLVRVVGEA